MTEQYTPTTAEVAKAYCDWDTRAFDRWLADRDREVAAKALEEAAAEIERRVKNDVINNNRAPAHLLNTLSAPGKAAAWVRERAAKVREEADRG